MIALLFASAVLTQEGAEQKEARGDGVPYEEPNPTELLDTVFGARETIQGEDTRRLLFLYHASMELEDVKELYESNPTMENLSEEDEAEYMSVILIDFYFERTQIGSKTLTRVDALELMKPDAITSYMEEHGDEIKKSLTSEIEQDL